MAVVSHPAEAKGTYVVVRTRSLFACLLHWVFFAAVVTGTVTGLYIAFPEYYYGRGEPYQAFAMANMRYYHFVAAGFLAAGALLRFYLSFTRSCNRDIKEFLPTPWNIANALKLAWFFLTFKGKFAHYRFVNPLGGIGIFIMSLCILIQIITGMMLYVVAADPGTWGWALAVRFDYLLGGQQTVRLIHHLTLYVLAFVVLIHVYMQIWKNSVFTESDISSIIAGYKVFPVSDLGHFADHYGLYVDQPAGAGAGVDEGPPSKEAGDD